MKSLMILGALVGFLIGMGFGLAGQSPWPTALYKSCAAALLAGVLARWWSRCWIQGLRDTLEQRERDKSAAPTVPKSTPAL